jgi:hypothetical protein
MYLHMYLSEPSVYVHRGLGSISPSLAATGTRPGIMTLTLRSYPANVIRQKAFTSHYQCIASALSSTYSCSRVALKRPVKRSYTGPEGISQQEGYPTLHRYVPR